jgi:RNA ligase (TIGR02306 family)
MSTLIVEVCKVERYDDHPNADRLGIIQVKDWNCIVGRNQYKEGDLVVFVPPDSIIPEKLIDKYNLEYLRNGGRVGTTKLRGCLSQGLILDLPEGKWKVGDDVSKVLEITKWEPPVAEYQKQANPISKKKLNPEFVKYTDIENVKNYKSIFHPEDHVVITEKIHGSNGRWGNLPIYIDSKQPFLYKLKLRIKKLLGHTHEFVYGSHNVQLHGNKSNNFYGDDLWGKIAGKYHLKDIIPEDYIVFGEVYGKGVQDLTYGLNSIDLVVFDVMYKGKYLGHQDFVQFCNERELPMVPQLFNGIFKYTNLEDLTNGKSILCPSQIREGCVVKMYDESNDARIGRKILKSVSPDYLMRKNGTEFH